MTLPPDLSALDHAAKDALILMLVARLDRLEAENAALRARLGDPPKTPANSSLPPRLGAKASSSEAAKAKAKPHGGAHRVLHPAPTRRIDARAGRCGHCAADVSSVHQGALESYDHIEIPAIAPEVTRVVLHGGICPCCAHRFKAAAPQGMARGSPFGANLRALVIYLRFTQAIGFDRLARLLGDLLGLDISEGALVNMLKAAKSAFAAQAARIRAKLLSGTALASDETSLRVGRANWWLWVFHHGDSAAFVAAPSRAKTVPEAFLAGARPDYWLSDRYGGQMGFAKIENQVCLAHLKRDLQFARDSGDEVLAPGLIALVGKACRIGRRRSRLGDATLKAYAARLEAGLDAILARQPTGKPGRKLKRMMRKIRRHLFVFVANREIEPTNNGSERALRPCVTFRKVTNGFRSAWGASLYADIRSVLETARRRAIKALDAIRLTLQNQPLAPSA
ncbi:MAG: IS66 family transposase [Aestuariivirga sp.]